MRPRMMIAGAALSAALCTLSASALAQPAPDAPDAPDASAAPRPLRAAQHPSEDEDAPPAPPPVAPAAAPSAPPPSAPPPPVVVAPSFREEPAPERPSAPHRQRFSAGLGFRGGVVHGAGYDPYSKNDSLPMATLFGTFTPWDLRPLSVHLAFEWDYGGSSATARGVPSSLTMHRIALGLEGRYMPITRMRFFARVMPSAAHVAAELRDPAFDLPLQTASWTWGVDLTAGAAARIGSVGLNESPKVSFWLGLDAGYRFAGATSMRFRPGDLTEADQTRRFGEMKMADLDLSGFIARLSFSTAF